MIYLTTRSNRLKFGKVLKIGHRYFCADFTINMGSTSSKPHSFQTYTQPSQTTQFAPKPTKASSPRTPPTPPARRHAPTETDQFRTSDEWYKDDSVEIRSACGWHSLGTAAQQAKFWYTAPITRYDFERRLLHSTQRRPLDTSPVQHSPEQKRLRPYNSFRHLYRGSFSGESTVLTSGIDPAEPTSEGPRPGSSPGRGDVAPAHCGQEDAQSRLPRMEETLA